MARSFCSLFWRWILVNLQLTIGECRRRVASEKSSGAVYMGGGGGHKRITAQDFAVALFLLFLFFGNCKRFDQRLKYRNE